MIDVTSFATYADYRAYCAANNMVAVSEATFALWKRYPLPTPQQRVETILRRLAVVEAEIANLRELVAILAAEVVP